MCNLESKMYFLLQICFIGFKPENQHGKQQMYRTNKIDTSQKYN
jgi:hypothetical protein